MPTLRERLKAFRNPSTAPVKYNGIGSLYSMMGIGADHASGNIVNGNSGYAQAYLSVLAVRQAVDYYAFSSQSIPSTISRNTTGDEDDTEIIATSSDVKPHDIWYAPTRHHHKTYGINPIMAMVYNMVLYDAVFVEKIRNQFKLPSNFRVLNTLGMDIDDYAGYISGYRYSWNNDYQDFRPSQIAYEHGFNPYQDYRGTSILQSAISKIQIENNLDRFLQAFFKNNATVGIVGSPATDSSGLGASLTYEEQATLRKIINDWHQGVSNSFRPLILNTPVDFTTLPNPNIGEHREVGKDIDKKILGAFGINPALVGSTDSTSYKDDLPAIESQFVNKRLKPILSQIESIINIDVLPFLTGTDDYRFGFDYEDYQLVTEQDTIALEINTTRLNSGTMAVNDYRKANKQQPIAELDDHYMIDGVPVPISEVANLWKYKFGTQQVASTETTDNPPSDESAKSHHHHHAPTDDMDYVDVAKAFQQDAPTLDNIFNELKTWLKYVKADKHLKSVFAPDKTRGDIGDAITAIGLDNKDAILTVINAQMDMVKGYIKAIQSTRLEYEIEVEDAIDNARQKKIDKRRFKLNMMQALRGYANLAFIDGLREGGVFSEPDDDDRMIIESHVRSHRQYVNNLADTIYGKGITDADASNKPAMWYNKSISPMYDAGKASADKNGIYEWVYGATEHCKDCQKLNGQRHRMKTYYAKGVLPQSDLLECKGFNCKCNLVRVSASARGRLPNL